MAIRKVNIVVIHKVNFVAIQNVNFVVLKPKMIVETRAERRTVSGFQQVKCVAIYFGNSKSFWEPKIIVETRAERRRATQIQL